jgi:aarF domain-containing kinase
MSGKRLLDAVQFLNVAKSVAGKHLAARQRQLDVYTRTSSLTKGVKQQTENFIVTAQAASALAQRFNEKSPSQSSYVHPGQSNNHGRAAPGDETAPVQRSREEDRENLGGLQDQSAETRSTSLSAEEAKKLQRQAEFQIPAKQAGHSLEGSPDELTVSQGQDTFYSPSSEIKPVLSALPRVKLPKVTGNVQGTDPHVTDGPINPDVFHSPVIGSNGADAPESSGPSEEMMKDLFHSPRVANLLASKKRRSHTETSSESPMVGKDGMADVSRGKANNPHEAFSTELSSPEAQKDTKEIEQFASTFVEPIVSGQGVRSLILT